MILAILYPFGVQKLHKHDQRPTGVTSPRFDHLHLTGAYSGKYGQTRLGVAASLTNGAERGGRHLETVDRIASRVSHIAPVLIQHPAKVASVRRLVSLTGGLEGAMARNHRSVLLVDVGENCVGHLGFSVAAEPEIPNNVRAVNKETAA